MEWMAAGLDLAVVAGVAAEAAVIGWRFVGAGLTAGSEAGLGVASLVVKMRSYRKRTKEWV